MKPTQFQLRQFVPSFARLLDTRRSAPLKIAALALVSSVGMANATVIDFALSPAGTSSAIGLSPANEVPPATTSTGSGDSVSGGISFNTETSTLLYTMGYGSAAGFTDLTGPATGMHIHGPAAAGASASVQVDLASTHFPAADRARGGLIFGSVILTAPQAANLLAGLNYVNIHTAAFPGGEIRGQLIRVNTSPEIVCPADQTVECGSSMTYSATVTDQDGEAMEVVWLLNGDPVQSNSLAAAGPPSGGVVKYTGTLPFGENTLTLVATDTYGNVTTCSSTIQVQDTIAPVIENVKFSPKVLWPPNHKMIPIKIVPKIVDACGGTTWEIVSVSSNQAADAKGSGNTSPDWKITGDHSVLLRAERSGKDKGGRVYTIRILATDQAGNKSDYSFVKVTVPHDQGKDKDKDKDKGKKDKDKDKGKKGDKDKGKKK